MNDNQTIMKSNKVMFVVCGDVKEIDENSKIIEPCEDVVNEFADYRSVSRTNPEFDSLKSDILRLNPVIIQFIGHGTKEGVLFGGEFISIEEMVTFFQALQQKPRLIVFSSCESLGLIDALAQKTGITCVGSKKKVTNRDNIGFLKPFFTELLKGNTVDRAKTIASSYVGKDNEGNHIFESRGANISMKEGDQEPTIDPQVNSLGKLLLELQAVRFAQKRFDIMSRVTEVQEEDDDFTVTFNKFVKEKYSYAVARGREILRLIESGAFSVSILDNFGYSSPHQIQEDYAKMYLGDSPHVDETILAGKIEAARKKLALATLPAEWNPNIDAEYSKALQEFERVSGYSVEQFVEKAATLLSNALALLYRGSPDNIYKLGNFIDALLPKYVKNEFEHHERFFHMLAPHKITYKAMIDLVEFYRPYLTQIIQTLPGGSERTITQVAIIDTLFGIVNEGIELSANLSQYRQIWIEAGKPLYHFGSP